MLLASVKKCEVRLGGDDENEVGDDEADFAGRGRSNPTPYLFNTYLFFYDLHRLHFARWCR